jgi:hypothetical protein
LNHGDSPADWRTGVIAAWVFLGRYRCPPILADRDRAVGVAR